MFNNKNHSTRFDKLGILQSGHFLAIPESSAFRRAIINGKGLLLIFEWPVAILLQGCRCSLV